MSILVCDGFLTERSDAAIVWRLAQTRRRHFGHNRSETQMVSGAWALVLQGK